MWGGATDEGMNQVSKGKGKAKKKKKCGKKAAGLNPE